MFEEDLLLLRFALFLKNIKVIFFKINRSLEIN